MKQTKSAFDSITANLGVLSPAELVELGTMIDTLLYCQEPQPETEQEDLAGGSTQAKRPAARGHIESKMIGKCGPYLYLRFWQGKTLKSKYIGKADSAAAESV